MPKKNESTATQELTARYLAAGAGFKPEEQFFALLNAASHVIQNNKGNNDIEWLKFLSATKRLNGMVENDGVMEPLADDKAPF